jgi:hypothetical protein
MSMGVGLIGLAAIQWLLAARKLDIGQKEGEDKTVLGAEVYGEALKLLIQKLPAQVITGLLLIILGIVVETGKWPYQ